MHLLKLTVSKDARIARDTLAERLAALQEDGAIAQAIVMQAWPANRQPGDALRVAASDALREFQDFTDARGRRCKVLAAKPVGAGAGVHLHIHVQARQTDNVEYSTLVCKLDSDKPDASDKRLETTSDGREDYPDIIDALYPPDLLRAGTIYLYESDLRRLLQGLLESVMVPLALWPGIWLVRSDAAGLVSRLERAFALPRGTVQLRLIGLDTSGLTRTALADELGEQFTSQADKLTERLSYPAPNLPALERDYAALCDKLAQTEELLGCAVPCWEVLERFELALLATKTPV